MVALIHIEGRNTGSCTWCVIVCELSEWDQAEPIVLLKLLVVAVDSDVLFQSLISSFGLSVTFRMVTRGEMKLHVKSETERLEEMQYEFGTSVGSDVAQDTMLRKDVNDE